MLAGTALSGCQAVAPAAPMEAPAASIEAPAASMESDKPFWGAGNADSATRFELARRSTPELIAFLRRMPKGADLHNHISGATYSD